MEEKNKQIHSIWGKWWEPIRKWFYPAWLIYETSYRFYEYSISTYNYFGETGNHVLAITTSIATFIICTAFLTVPTCFVLYKFFKIDDLTKSLFEEKMKRFL